MEVHVTFRFRKSNPSLAEYYLRQRYADPRLSIAEMPRIVGMRYAYLFRDLQINSYCKGYCFAERYFSLHNAERFQMLTLESNHYS